MKQRGAPANPSLDDERRHQPTGYPATPATATTSAIAATPAFRSVRFHDLRHPFAVLQLSAGAQFMQVSKWLSHSTYTLALDVHGYYIPESDGGALNTPASATHPRQS